MMQSKQFLRQLPKKAKFVLDADIAQCFDKISHEELLRKMNTFSLAGRVIRGWLKAGVMDGGNLFPTSEGTPARWSDQPIVSEYCATRVGNVHPQPVTGKEKQGKTGNLRSFGTPTILWYSIPTSK